MGCTFKRLQCTPDLLPTDVTGVSVFNQKSGEFEFRPGPVFAQTLLADEINRATPRTQSALLEAMAERRVSADGQTYVLKPPFLVLATQNPIDQEGTFPLPEAQLDRFLVRLSLGYPTLEEEGKMLTRLQKGHPIEDLKAVVSAEDVIACQDAIREIHIDEKVKRYILEVVHASRSHEDILLGGSPRASIALFRTAQRSRRYRAAITRFRRHQKMAQPALHRLILKPESWLRKHRECRRGRDLIEDAKVPIIERQKATSEDFFER